MAAIRQLAETLQTSRTDSDGDYQVMLVINNRLYYKNSEKLSEAEGVMKWYWICICKNDIGHMCTGRAICSYDQGRDELYDAIESARSPHSNVCNNGIHYLKAIAYRNAILASTK